MTKCEAGGSWVACARHLDYAGLNDDDRMGIRCCLFRGGDNAHEGHYKTTLRSEKDSLLCVLIECSITL